MPTDSPAPSPAITTTPKVDVARVRTAIQHRFVRVHMIVRVRVRVDMVVVVAAVHDVSPVRS